MEADLILCISLFGTFFVGLCLPILVDKIISIFIKDEEKQEIVLSRLFNNPATPFLVILLSLTLIMWVIEGCVARNYHNIEKCEELSTQFNNECLKIKKR